MSEARRLIEPAVIRRLIDTLTPEKTARLRQHLELEVDARRAFILFSRQAALSNNAVSLDFRSLPVAAWNWFAPLAAGSYNSNRGYQQAPRFKTRPRPSSASTTGFAP